MIFNCEPRRKAIKAYLLKKSNARITKRDNYLCNAITWHKWFAWYPITTETDECVWLELIERRFKQLTSYIHDKPHEPSYRLIKEGQL